MIDPFGGIKGKELTNTSGFLVDKEEAIKEVNVSIDILENKNIKKPTFLETLRSKNTEIHNNVWDYVPNTNNEYVNIHIFWSKKVVRSKNGVPIRALKVALVGLKAFYRQINTLKPDLQHPDILECYKLSLENYQNLPPIDSFISSEKQDLLLDPFAGVTGIDIYKKYNDLKKDKDLTLEEVKCSINFIDQLELPKSKRDKKFITKKPKFVTFTFPTSESYLNVHLWWAGQIIQTRKNIEIGRTRLALASISKFIENIDVETPDLEIEEITSVTLSECYDVESLEIETSDNQEYQLIFDDSELEDNIRSELLQDSDYEHMYCEGIKAENINPVSTPFTDWIDEIINYDGIGSIISGYDGELNELSDNSVWFRRN